MLTITLTARETSLITLAKDEALPPFDEQMEKMRQEIIDAWVSQNPDHADMPWLQL